MRSSLTIASLCVFGAGIVTAHLMVSDGSLAHRTEKEDGGGAAWYAPADLPDLDNFTDEIRLLGLATKYSYTATHGSYYENWTVNATLGPDWVKDFDLSPNPEVGGMHALTFIRPSFNASERGDAQSNTNSPCRGLIAFRGTDLGSDVLSSLADNCADDVLWGGMKYEQLSANCQGNFTTFQLDYLARATDVTQRAMVKYPQCSFLFTGHSLGAGLANLMAALSYPQVTSGSQPPAWATGCLPRASAGAAVFSTPGYIHTLLNRTNITFDQGMYNKNSSHSTQQQSKRFMLFADQFDPIWYFCNQSFQGGYIGRRCLWHDGAQPAACKKCERGHRMGRTVECELCMYERHIFSHYLHLIRAPRDPSQGLHCESTANLHRPCRRVEDQCENLVETGCQALQ